MSDVTFDVINITSENRGREGAYVSLDVHGSSKPLRMKADTGAQANTLPFHTYKQMFPENTDKAMI